MPVAAETQQWDFEGKAHFEGRHVVLDFGEHKGKRLDAIPRGYLALIVDVGLPEDLVTAIEEELGHR